MFFSFFLFTVVILSLVSVQSFFQLETQLNMWKISQSITAYYSAESTHEQTLYDYKVNKESAGGNTSIKSFNLEAEQLWNMQKEQVVGAYHMNIANRSYSDSVESFESIGARPFDEFRFIDVDKDPFVSLVISYKTNEDDNSLPSNWALIDVIRFPRNYFASSITATPIDFGSIKELYKKWQKTISNNVTVSRIMHFFTSNISSNWVCEWACADNWGLEFSWLAPLDADYQFAVKIEGFSLDLYNYIVRFTNLNAQPVHYKLTAMSWNWGGVPIRLKNQLLEVDSLVNSNSIYQRVISRQRSFAPLQQGLWFALFSDQSISK